MSLTQRGAAGGKSLAQQWLGVNEARLHFINMSQTGKAVGGSRVISSEGAGTKVEPLANGVLRFSEFAERGPNVSQAVQALNAGGIVRRQDLRGKVQRAQV